MTSELLDFIQNRVSSFVRWDLIRYFNESPTRKETSDLVAKGTGRDSLSVEHELEALVLAKILAHEDKEDVRRYKLARDKATRQLIADFSAACFDRQFRIEAIQVLINSINFSSR